MGQSMGCCLPNPYLPDPHLPNPYLPNPHLPNPHLPNPYLPNPYLPNPYLPNPYAFHCEMLMFLVELLGPGARGLGWATPNISISQ